MNQFAHKLQITIQEAHEGPTTHYVDRAIISQVNLKKKYKTRKALAQRLRSIARVIESTVGDARIEDAVIIIATREER